MINKISIAIFFAAALALVGCNNMNSSYSGGWTAEPETKMCPGAMGKVKLTSQPLLASMISGATRDLMDQSDEKLARDAALRALENSPVGVSQYWLNPNTDNRGESKVLKVTDKGRCRLVFSNVIDQTDMQIGSETVTYCKNTDMNWSTK